MTFAAIKIAGAAALDTLHARRAAFETTGEYPFLIGDAEDLERLQQAAEFNDQEYDEIIEGSMDLDVDGWLQNRRAEAEQYEFSVEETLGPWPGEELEKGSISLHLEVLSRKLKKEVFLGLANIGDSWQLPAVLKYGAWNDCPEPEVHCAFNRRWQSEFGAEIAGMSGDVVECVVKKPPRDRDAALALAWQQYWYCADIVEQGCGSVSKLAAILLNSEYWYFWWD